MISINFESNHKAKTVEDCRKKIPKNKAVLKFVKEYSGRQAPVCAIMESIKGWKAGTVQKDARAPEGENFDDRF